LDANLPSRGLKPAKRLLVAVLGIVLRVDERAPQHDAAVGTECLGEHVGAIGMVASVVVRPRLPFGVGLDDQPPKSGIAR
jgi:hypothetical protein